MRAVSIHAPELGRSALGNGTQRVEYATGILYPRLVTSCGPKGPNAAFEEGAR